MQNSAPTPMSVPQTVIPKRKAIVEETTSENQIKPELPSAPPNYRGMIYDMVQGREENQNAEGIERIARDDETYGDYEKNIRRREYMQKREKGSAFSHFNVPVERTVQSEQKNGLHKLIDGLQNMSFSPEDVLICAMIILMLNSKSEDDILMVLVLMMLL